MHQRRPVDRARRQAARGGAADRRRRRGPSPSRANARANRSGPPWGNAKSLDGSRCSRASSRPASAHGTASGSGVTTSTRGHGCATGRRPDRARMSTATATPTDARDPQALSQCLRVGARSVESWSTTSPSTTTRHRRGWSAPGGRQPRRHVEPVPRVDGDGHRDHLAEFLLGEDLRGLGVDLVGDVAVVQFGDGLGQLERRALLVGEQCRRPPPTRRSAPGAARSHPACGRRRRACRGRTRSG